MTRRRGPTQRTRSGYHCDRCDRSIGVIEVIEAKLLCAKCAARHRLRDEQYNHARASRATARTEGDHDD